MIFPESLESHRRAFLEAMRVRGRAPATIHSERQSLEVFFRYLAQIGLDDLREVTRPTVRDYQAWLMKSGRYSVRTVHTRMVALRRFFEHLECTDAILLNPCHGLLLPKLEQRLPRRVLTVSEARAVLNAPDTQTLKGIRDKAILELFYTTGIRSEEMAKLTVLDVDYQNGYLRVNLGKGAKDRVVPVGRKACDYLREYLRRVRAEWVKRNPDRLRDERALWLSPIRPHQPMGKAAIALMVRKTARAAGLARPVSPHVWRHTCATHLVADGANVAAVQRLLGHRSVNTTQIYTRVSLPEIKQSYRKAHPRAGSLERSRKA